MSLKASMLLRSQLGRLNRMLIFLKSSKRSLRRRTPQKLQISYNDKDRTKQNPQKSSNKKAPNPALYPVGEIAVALRGGLDGKGVTKVCAGMCPVNECNITVRSLNPGKDKLGGCHP
eukprot:TRINITY_DN37350_c0_g1_i1.p1 TRINITY_DN37350_c0_g1~~TRINITY_DN37350_c0_g1_i1.p1  ORF type:complete len:117 (+),score=9.19 TRINITY_DN37350_c0_g1_i1:154-504(+)